MPDPTERAALPDQRACADCGAVDDLYWHDVEGAWVCDEVSDCRDRQWETDRTERDRLRADADQGAPDAMLALERSLTDDKVATLEADNERLREERDGLRDVIENAMAALRMAHACDETDGTR